MGVWAGLAALHYWGKCCGTVAIMRVGGWMCWWVVDACGWGVESRAYRAKESKF